MKKTLGLLLSCLALCGCLNSSEKLSINDDNSGIIETHLKVHSGTLQMIDTMFGGMMEAFSKMGSQMQAQNGSQQSPVPPPPASMAEQMFADKEQIMKKFSKAGVKAELLSFESQKKDDGLYVDYKVKVDNVLLLMNSEALGTKVDVVRNEKGDWYCRLKQDEKKISESKGNLKSFEEFKNSPQYKAMPPEIQAKMAGSMMDFKVEFTIVFPRPVKFVSGGFEKIDDNTAKYSLSMNFLADPTAMEKLLAANNGQPVAATDEGFLPPADQKSPDVASMPMAMGDVTAQPQVAESSAGSSAQSGAVTVKLKNGNMVKGQVVERGKDFIRINFEGVPITYYNDEIEKVE
ncbi:MAG: hypothetical protein HQL16_06035 [Candidatus Omnitrophica bacterium]|nr:hypothetical protein [Candidatus Omnitrophota bacterium]